MKWIKLQEYQEYQETISLMEKSLQEVIDGSKEVIYSLEHSDVYTAGVSAKAEELLNPGNIPVYATGRGGRYTYHGPGQLVIYPIISLQKHNLDLHTYVRNLEQIIINSLALIDIAAFTIHGKVGIWVTPHNQSLPKKIAAIGIRIKKWVTYHGIAINVNNDLSKFDGIIPCGISQFGITSIEDMGIKITLKKFEQIVQKEFLKVIPF
jgi:lipoyl(octanoyl) transferase